MENLKRLIAELEPVESVKETHLSCVYLTAHYVFKIKKNENLGFVDFTSGGTRTTAALDEVRLNRRLASDIYRGCTFISRTNGTASWGALSVLDPESIPIGAHFDEEALVVMRRLQDDRSLVSLIRHNHPDASRFILPLAERLAAFHREHPIDAQPVIILRAFERQMMDNFDALREATFSDLRCAFLLSIFLGPLQQWACEQLATWRSVLEERVRNSRVVDGHGDLRAEHIYFEGAAERTNSIQIIDCIEFSDELRKIDAASDIAFICMDLDYLHRADMSRALATDYAAAARDPSVLDVLKIFKVYRALVRAKVHAMRAAQLNGTEKAKAEEQTSSSYLALANRYSLAPEKALVVIVAGLMGSGKSTVAGIITEMLHATCIASDHLRKDIYRDCVESKSSAFGEGIYTSNSREKVYASMFAEAASLLSQDEIVVLDATFGTHALREKAYDLARQFNAQCLLIECVLPRELTLIRLAERFSAGGSISDGRPELYEDQLKFWEHISPQEVLEYHRVETGGDLLQTWREVFRTMKNVW